MASTSITERFNTPHYNKFKEIITKSGLDASVKIKNNKVHFGSTSIEVPYFKSVNDVKEELEDKKLKLLLQSNDLYDKIIISDDPHLYKNKYQKILSEIQQIDTLVDEIDSYIDSINQIKVTNPIMELKQEIDNNRMKTEYTINDTVEDVHTSKKVISKLVSYHNTAIKLEQQLKEAKEVSEVSYIIWDKPLEDKITNTEVSVISSKKSPSKSKRLTPAKKAIIKKTTKHLMIDKLS